MLGGGWKLPLYIMYFNLKDGVSEEEFVKKTREFLDSGKVEGIESTKLYRQLLSLLREKH